MICRYTSFVYVYMHSYNTNTIELTRKTQMNKIIQEKRGKNCIEEKKKMKNTFFLYIYFGSDSTYQNPKTVSRQFLM